MGLEEAEHFRQGTRRVDEGVVVEVVLDRPRAMNALPMESVGTLTAAVERLDRTDGDVLEISGAGEEFCAGADVTELASETPEGIAAGLSELQALVRALRTSPLPVVAAVEGRAFGAGFLLCQAADVVIATEGTRFGLQEVSLGLPVAGYATTLLPRLVGERRAREWLLLGKTVPATEAAGAGFVSKVVAEGDLRRTADGYAGTLADNGAVAMEELKRLLAASDDLSSAAKRERQAVRTAFEDGDAGERLAAFLEDG